MTTAPTPARAELQSVEQLRQLEQILGKQVFFVVGCQKSGTTWVERLLNGHPSIRCHGEGYFAPLLLPLLSQAVQAYNGKQKAGEEGKFTEADLQLLFTAAAAICFKRWAGDRDVLAIGEKTPEHALCMGVLNQCFPGAKFIHIVRDGRDACVSGWFHNLRQGGEKFRQRFPDLNAYIRYMVTEHWLKYIGQARAFGAQHPEQYMELRYEDLHADPRGQTARMLEFLGVDASVEAVAACAGAGSFERLAQGRSRGEEDQQSFFRKGIVGDWRNHFDESNRQTFLGIGGELLGQLGYAC
jgi:hypothetical protein